MNDKDKGTCFFIVLTVPVGAILTGALLVWGKSTTRWRDDAVNRGHAEYYLDAQHNKQWRWKTNCVHDVWANPPAEATVRKP